MIPSRFEALAFETPTRLALLAFEQIAHQMPSNGPILRRVPRSHATVVEAKGHL
jgi:hypothetical protein